MTSDIISLTDLIESKLKKEQEIDYYKETLLQLQKKIGVLSKEVSITSLIIDMIEQERVLTLSDKRSSIIKLEEKVKKGNNHKILTIGKLQKNGKTYGFPKEDMKISIMKQ